MEDEARSVFVLVRYYGSPYRCGLYEIKIQQGGERIRPHGPVVTLFDKTNFEVSKFFRLALDTISTQLPGRSSNSKLYLFLNEGLNLFNSLANCCEYDSYSGYVLDTKTRSLQTLKPVLASKPVSFVMSTYVKLYNLASPVCFSKMPETLFERYDPKTESWESLTHFEYSRDRSHMDITGYAVCYGCILVSIGRGRVGFMVFDIGRSTWHQINISRSDAYFCGFRGRAVVVNDTIYALSIQCGKVISLSLRIDSEDDGSFIYSLEKPFVLPGLKSRVEEDLKLYYPLKPTEYLVHMGKLEFCLLQTASTGCEGESQELFITTFEIVHDETMHIKTLDFRICDLHIKGYGPFSVSFCFTPECKDLEPKREEIFQLDKRKETAKKNEASHSKVHDVGTEGYDRFMDDFVFMLLTRKRVLGNYPLKFELSRLAVPVIVTVIGFCLFFILCNRTIRNVMEMFVLTNSIWINCLILGFTSKMLWRCLWWICNI